jgi:hypothetical protein
MLKKYLPDLLTLFDTSFPRKERQTDGHLARDYEVRDVVEPLMFLTGTDTNSL